MNKEASLTHGGVTYALNLNVNALCRLEDATEKPYVETILELIAAATDPKTLGIRTIRTVMAVALSNNHPEITEEAAGDIMTGVGLVASLNAIHTALAASNEKLAPKPKPRRTAKS